MSNAVRARRAVASHRVALTQLIEEKLNRLDLPALIKLAAELNIAVPAKLRAAQRGDGSSLPKLDPVEFSGDGIGPIVSMAEGGRLLDAITIDDASADWADSELLGAGDLADRLYISRGTLDNWRKANKIIGLRKGLRNFVYPTRQFERLKPIDGLDRVAPFFPTPEDAWQWLVMPNRMTGDLAPIECLRKGEMDDVARAAEGALDYA